MKHNAAEKNGNSLGKSGNRPALTVLHGGLYAPRILTPEQNLDRAFREICASCKVRRPGGTIGAYASRAVADIAQNLRWPLRVIARIIAGVIEGEGDEDFTARLAAALLEYDARKRSDLGRRRQMYDDRGLSA